MSYKTGEKKPVIIFLIILLAGPVLFYLVINEDGSNENVSIIFGTFFLIMSIIAAILYNRVLVRKIKSDIQSDDELSEAERFYKVLA